MKNLFRAVYIITLMTIGTSAVIMSKNKLKTQDIKGILETKLVPKVAEKLTEPAPRKRKKGKITFSYQNKEIVEVINDVAAAKKINIILPQGTDAITGKLTFHYPEKISVQQAWDLLQSILDTAGRSLIPKGSMYHIVNNTQQDPAYKKPLPLYINIHPDSLPNTDQRIRYVYYFSNITLQDQPQFDNINLILTDMMPPEDKQGVILDKKVNGVIVASTANRIKSAMKIISALDQSGFAESIEVVKLKYVAADFVEQLFMGSATTNPPQPNGGSAGLIPTKKQDFRYPWHPQEQKKKRAHYFTENTRVVAISRTNSLAIMGKIKAIDRIKDFIKKYIDVEIQTNKSIIHTIELNNLEAKDFAKTLTHLIKGKEDEKHARDKKTEEHKKYNFENVIIAAEEHKKGDEDTSGTTVDKSICKAEKKLQALRDTSSVSTAEEPIKSAHLGGNKLIIAAREQEWLVIEQLIRELDVAQPQVAIEALIVDLSIDDARALGTQLRNKLNAQVLMDDLNFQAAHLNQPWLNFNDDSSVADPPGLTPDLLSSNTDAKGNLTYITNNFDAGSTAVSFGEKYNNQEGVWGILQMLNHYVNAQEISRPFVVVSNNECALLSIKENRLVQGGVQQQNDSTQISIERIDAGIDITLIPRINDQHYINLSITIDVNEFTKSATQGGKDRKTRHIATNATIKNQQILVLGGLDKDSEDETKLETPVLGKVPLLGWLFKKRRRSRKKETLMVFIIPRILKPRLSGVSPHAWQKYNYLNDEIKYQQRTFDKTLDPITQTFFDSISKDSEKEIKKFMEGKIWEAVNKKDQSPPKQKTKSKTKKDVRKKTKKKKNKTKKKSKKSSPAPNDRRAKLKQLVARTANPLAPVPS